MLAAFGLGILGALATLGSAAMLATRPALAASDAEDAPPAIVREARLAGDARRTRLVLDLDRATEFRVFTLANPSRVILDLSNVHFALAPDAPPTGRGLVSAFRFGVFAPGKARMVLEVTGPVAVDKAFVLEALDDQPARLVVDLVKTDPDTFARGTASVTEQRAAAAPAMPAPAPAAPAGDERPVVVVDPGHGGIDSGTTGYSAFTEKTIVLEIALALRDKLERTGAVRVVLTRSTDTFIPLGERVRLARNNRAALFISLHADALARGDGQARGASVYTLADTASDADAARLAESENKADLIAGVDLSEETDEVAGILVDLAQRETRNFSARVAHTLVGSMKGAVRLHRTPLKSAGFRVLRAHDVPSVLVELGYMSSPEDRKDLTSDAWRERVTDAMSQAIIRFFAARGPLTSAAPDGDPAGR
ncbi:N-acetylmuramoyl-L-alanine amidase [Xanthobacter dioxanivorans]|uniref:N-acetylmuramoyl-L-alanine amidase n=1 Tax=Xanthobacter dioxanivorans TaxID=2528964 RepID=UPI001E6243E4|nr:N-acetylmuramoyl-L-alanine amidase [Xanthobacter dioxanivorans]